MSLARWLIAASCPSFVCSVSFIERKIVACFLKVSLCAEFER